MTIKVPYNLNDSKSFQDNETSEWVIRFFRLLYSSKKIHRFI
jgi:hypothetical protein